MLTFLFSYGKKILIIKNILIILKKLKFDFGYSVENRSVTKNDIKKILF